MKLLYAWLLTSYINCNQITVYVCDSKYATRYHYKSDCRGLSNCKHRIISIPLDKATATRTLCMWER
ncbi:hypothetical protein [uncultured Chitinophaga sp.]|uniref:hypothetical protein n=1 Tax=uncultured Chitinophaga sp. TaxID=339340 RepID=UPI00260BF4AE|nr:hypothetical protein [uncultured Chitinophaga sp.]